MIQAMTGERALSVIEADPTRFRGLITDINLGKEPDGWEVARRGRELIPGLPVLYVSVDAADWPSKGVPKSIMVTKPFASAQIITAISTCLSGPIPVEVAKLQRDAKRLRVLLHWAKSQIQ